MKKKPAPRKQPDRTRRKPPTGLAGELLRIGKECAAHINEPLRSVDHGDLLYDEKGLPGHARRIPTVSPGQAKRT